MLSWSAQARPAGPEPTMATLFSVLTFGASGIIIPLEYAYSMIKFSFSLTLTGSPLSPQVQAASQRAGQTLEVNSGKLFVIRSLWAAASYSFVKIRSFHSGIKLLRGQPDTIPIIGLPFWQKGTPQSIHLDAC